LRPRHRYPANSDFRKVQRKVIEKQAVGRLEPVRKSLRVPDGKTRFLTPECDERGVRREEDDVFSFGHAQQQTVERITVRLRGFHTVKTCSSVTDRTVAPADRISSRNRAGAIGNLPWRCLRSTSQTLTTDTARGEPTINFCDNLESRGLAVRNQSAT
jgi:hypothetical protein